MKIGAFTIITDPEHRQDPWQQGIAQMLEVFDVVAVVYGREQDGALIESVFKKDMDSGKLVCKFLNWPQPQWSYDELPKHLNLGLDTLRELGCAWAVRLDIDTAVHEKDALRLRCTLGLAHGQGNWLAALEKYQFFKPTKCYEKGKIPVAVNLHKPVRYGFDFDRYTDLCQPIVWDGKQTALINGKDTGVPAGRQVPDKRLFKISLHVWNYDYTFKTEERAVELLYQFDRAHERFWGQGYSGKRGKDITPESAMSDFMALSMGRLKKMHIVKEIDQHPRHFKQSLKELSNAQWGFDLWGKAVQ